MRNKLNIILATAIAALVTTAYATTCYLNAVSLAYVNGDLLASGWCFHSYTGGGCTATSYCCSWNAGVYADENAYWPDLIAVTRGGKNLQAANTFLAYPSGDSDAANGYGAGQNGNWGTDPQRIFKVYYYNPNVGSTVTGYNGPPGGFPSLPVTAFIHPTAHYLDSNATSCN